MKNYFKILIICILGTLLLSSCNNSSSAESSFIAQNESLIKEITSSYLTEINSGAFATQLYNSKLSPELVIKGLSFAQPQAQALMNESMAYMTFKIYGVKPVEESFGDIFDKRIKANCLVEVSVVDIENSFKKINSPFLGYSDLIKRLPQSDKTSITKKNIILKLAYSEEKGKWEIIDNSELIKLVIDPYTRMTLENPAGSPDATVDEFIRSVRSLDTKKLIELSGVNPEEDPFNYGYHNLVDGLGINLDEMKRILPYVQIEVIPDFDLLPKDEIYYWTNLAKIPLTISFPDIRAALGALNHQASIDEIVDLLEKNQHGQRIIFDEKILSLSFDSSNQVWHTTDEHNSADEDYGIPNVIFKYIVKNVKASIYSHPNLLSPVETADQYMKYLSSGDIEKATSLSQSSAPAWYTGKEFVLNRSSSYTNDQIMKELIEGYNYTFLSIDKTEPDINAVLTVKPDDYFRPIDKEKPDMPTYIAKYSISLPDLSALQSQIYADHETLAPMLKPLLEKYLSSQLPLYPQTTAPPTEEDERFFYRSYVDYIKSAMKNSNLPVREYEINIILKPAINSPDTNWYIYDFLVLESNSLYSFVNFTDSKSFYNVMQAAINLVVFEGVFTREDFADLDPNKECNNLY